MGHSAPNRIAEFSVAVDGLDHPEDIVRGPDGLLYAGGEAGQVYRVDLEKGQVTELGSTGGALLGIVLDGSGSAYVCDYRRQAVFRVRVTDGLVEIYSTGTGEHPLRMPNGLAFASDGTLYVTDSGSPGGILNSPANLGFGGKNRDVVVAANLGRRHVAAANLGLRGLALNYPAI
jgi:sugar lactone lactonase YvrE